MDRPTSSLSTRISRDHLFMSTAWLFAMRSTCLRGQVGAVAVINNRIIATGYNGSPSGHEHCSPKNGCNVDEGSCPNSIHAEANLIAFAARSGVALEGATLYCTHEPCKKCAQLIVQAGFVKVMYSECYANHLGSELLIRSNITITKRV